MKIYCKIKYSLTKYLNDYIRIAWDIEMHYGDKLKMTVTINNGK